MTIKYIGRDKIVQMWDHNFQWSKKTIDCLFKLSKWIIRINFNSLILYISIWAIVSTLIYKSYFNMVELIKI